MNSETFVLCICLFTVADHVSLLWMRGYLINELRREQNRMKTQWQDFKGAQEEWKNKFEEEHKAPWVLKRKTA